MQLTSRLGNCNRAVPDVHAIIKQEAKEIVKAIRRNQEKRNLSGDCFNLEQLKKEAGKEPDMITNTYDDVRNSRSYLDRRFNQEYRFAEEKLGKKFGLTDDSAPNYGQELVDRILAGKYEVKPDPWGGTNIRWRDPSVKEDRDGFNAAMKQVDHACQKGRDIAALLTIPEGFAALEDFTEFTDELVEGKKSKK